MYIDNLDCGNKKTGNNLEKMTKGNSVQRIRRYNLHCCFEKKSENPCHFLTLIYG